MGAPTIKLLQENPFDPYECGMCRERTRRNKFSWKSWFTKAELIICRECAYKERYGTKKIKKAKKERILEQKKTNQ